MLFGLRFSLILTSPFEDTRMFSVDIRGWSSFLDQMDCMLAKTYDINKGGMGEG
jgi:hypothetical protein